MSLFCIASSVLKLDHYLIRGEWESAAPVLRSVPLVAIGCLAELAIALGLWTRVHRAAAWFAMAFLTFASGIVAYGRMTSAVSGVGCGCLGRIPLRHIDHVLITVALATLLSMIILDGSRLRGDVDGG